MTTTDDGDGDEEAHEPEDPLDQVVHSILTKDVKSPSARLQFAEMITAAKKPPVPKSVEVKLERSSRRSRSSHDEPYTFVNNFAWPDEEESEEDDGLSDDDDDDVDVRTPGRRSSSFLYSDAHRFPDITAQVMRLNQGRRLEFTTTYEDYLWKSNLDLYEPDFDDDYESSDDEDLPDSL